MALFVVAVAVGPSAYSQANGWSVDDCIRYGVAHSPTMERESAQVDMGRQNYVEAIAQQLPTVEAQSSASWTFGRLSDPRTNEYVTQSRIFGNRYTISTDMTLFAGFSMVNNTRMSYVNKLVGMEHRLQVANSLAMSIATACYDVSYRKGVFELAKEQLAQSEQAMRQLVRMGELGMKSQGDVAEVRAKHATDGYNLTLCRNEYQSALIGLKRLMCYAQPDSLPLLPIARAEVAYTPQRIDELFQRAYSSQPKIREAEYRLRKSLLQVYVARGGTAPNLSIGGGYSTSFSKDLNRGGDDSYQRQLKDLANQYVEVRLRIPIFSGLKVRSNINRKKMEHRIEQATFDETTQQLYAEVAKAVMEYEGSLDAQVQADRQVDALELAYSANRQKYAEGLVTIIELHSSANSLLKAKVEALKAHLLYAYNARVVEYYGGKLFVEI